MTARPRPVDVRPARAMAAWLVVAVAFLAACGGDDASPGGSPVDPSSVATTAPASTPVEDAGDGTDDTDPTGTTDSTDADGAVEVTPAPSTPSTVATTVAPTVAPTPATAAPTTLGDLLSEAEVAEVEAALDDLDALLDAIDADLLDVPDP